MAVGVQGAAQRPRSHQRSRVSRLSPSALRDLHARLKDAYGPQSWWPAGSELEMIVGAILVQNTAWTGARKALDNLRDAGMLDVQALRAAPEARLAELIRPSGFFNSKARKLKAFVEMLSAETEGDLGALLARPLHDLRPLLLATHGFGPETADAVCLYAGRRRTFIIDAYTRRILRRLELIEEDAPYERLRAAFLEALPGEPSFFAEYHSLFVVHAKQRCKKRPLCAACPLLDLCPTGQAETGLVAVDGPRSPRSRRRPADWNR